MEKGNQSHEVRIWKRSPSNSFSTFLHCPPHGDFSRLVFFLITPLLGLIPWIHYFYLCSLAPRKWTPCIASVGRPRECSTTPEERCASLKPIAPAEELLLLNHPDSFLARKSLPAFSFSTSTPDPTHFLPQHLPQPLLASQQGIESSLCHRGMVLFECTEPTLMKESTD